MSGFKASNDITITERTVGLSGVVLTDENGANTLDGFDYLSYGEMNALREYFVAQEDERLGRWRWPENPDYVVYPDSGGRGQGINVLRESSAYMEFFYPADDLDGRRGDFTSAARAYFDAHPEPSPWASAQFITWKDGAYLWQIAQRDLGGMHLGWRINVADDPRWVSEEELAEIIGGLTVTVLVPAPEVKS